MAKTGTFISVASSQEGATPRLVTETEPFPVEIKGSDGVEKGTEDNPFEISETLSPFTFLEYAHRHTGVLSTLAVQTVAGTDYTVTVVNGALFAPGDDVQISNGTQEATFLSVISVAVNVLTLDRYIDEAHPIGTTVEIIDTDMSSTAGSVAVPVEYVINPDDTRVVHVQRITISMIHSTAGDLDKFGDLAPLINGIQLRVRTDGEYRTLTNWKTNQQIKDDGYDVDFNTRSGGGGTYGTSARITFERFGTEVRLDPATNDQLELYVKDATIVGLIGMQVKGQGHYR